MNKNDYIIRLERKEEYRDVENLVRESFWNVYRPGCQEHYILKQLRDDPAFVHELAFVMEKEMRVIGCTVVILDASQLSIIYASTKKTDKGDALKLARLVKIYEKECLFSAAEMAQSSTDEHPCPSVDGEFWQSQNIASVL